MTAIFYNDGHFEFENVKCGFLDLNNPRKVLLHKLLGSGKRNLPNYFQYDIGGSHFEKAAKLNHVTLKSKMTAILF